MKSFLQKKGFTLVELLLVIVVIGLMLAVIVPRGYRANVEAKYGLVRQAASDLGSYGTQWIEQMINAQDVISSATLADYVNTLSASDGSGANWIPLTGKNWAAGGAAPKTKATSINTVSNRRIGGSATDNAPEASVEDITPPDKWPLNPFNGVAYYMSGNNATSAVTPGAISCNWAIDSTAAAGNSRYAAFVFQGADSTLSTAGDPQTFHAGQNDSTLAGLRNGVFWLRVSAR